MVLVAGRRSRLRLPLGFSPFVFCALCACIVMPVAGFDCSIQETCTSCIEENKDYCQWCKEAGNEVCFDKRFSHECVGEIYTTDTTVCSFKCMIATAAYGSGDHKNVHLFRIFRDEWLAHYYIGLQVIEVYYRYSPPLADLIAKHETFKIITRMALSPLAALLGFYYGD